MTHSDIQRIREEVSRARTAMTAGGTDDLAARIQALESAVGSLRDLERTAVPAADEDQARLKAELEALRQELQRTDVLLRHGEEFWRAWARMLGIDTGYTPSGSPGYIEGTFAAAHVKVEG